MPQKYLKLIFKPNSKYISLTNSTICQVDVYQLYISKLYPKCTALWQKPKMKIKNYDGPWFDKVPVGKDTLGNIMKVISEKANLSKVYTNHCICHTVVDLPDENEFEARDIMAQTGHKSESSVRSYRSKISSKKCRQMSECLAKNMENKPPNEPPAKRPAKATVSVPPPTDWLEVDPEDDQLSYVNLLEILGNIEKENAHLVPKNSPNKMLQPTTNTNTINISNVSNVQRALSFPGMYFPNSNVTINYINNYKNLKCLQQNCDF